MIGILSDSHDNIEALADAVQAFRELSCSLIVHAGDIIAPFAAREMQAAGCPVRAVFGNCDGETEGLKKIIAPFGEIQSPPFIFHHQNRKILITHTHFSISRHIQQWNPDILIYGHTHKPEIRHEQETLVINPGEAGGWVTGRKTAAVLNPETLQTEILSF